MAAAAPQRSEREMLAEMLELARAGANNDVAAAGILGRLQVRVAMILDRVGVPAEWRAAREAREENALLTLRRVLDERAKSEGETSIHAIEVLAHLLAGYYPELVTGVGAGKKGDEQAGEAQLKREQHRVHAPSLKRTDGQGKTGGEEK